MNKTYKKQWLKALQSGKYKKGIGQLHSGEEKDKEWCCIGVYCSVREIRIVKGGLCTVKPISGEYMYGQADAEIGINHVSNLAAINDSSDDFKKVIKYIEKNL